MIKKANQPIPESLEQELTKAILETPLSDIDLSITLKLCEENSESERRELKARQEAITLQEGRLNTEIIFHEKENSDDGNIEIPVESEEGFDMTFHVRPSIMSIKT